MEPTHLLEIKSYFILYVLSIFLGLVLISPPLSVRETPAQLYPREFRRRMGWQLGLCFLFLLTSIFILRSSPVCALIPVLTIPPAVFVLCHHCLQNRIEAAIVGLTIQFLLIYALVPLHNTFGLHWVHWILLVALGLNTVALRMVLHRFQPRKSCFAKQVGLDIVFILTGFVLLSGLTELRDTTRPLTILKSHTLQWPQVLKPILIFKVQRLESPVFNPIRTEPRHQWITKIPDGFVRTSCTLPGQEAYVPRLEGSRILFQAYTCRNQRYRPTEKIAEQMPVPDQPHRRMEWQIDPSPKARQEPIQWSWNQRTKTSRYCHADGICLLLQYPKLKIQHKDQSKEISLTKEGSDHRGLRSSQILEDPNHLWFEFNISGDRQSRIQRLRIPRKGKLQVFQTTLQHFAMQENQASINNDCRQFVTSKHLHPKLQPKLQNVCFGPELEVSS